MQSMRQWRIACQACDVLSRCSLALGCDVYIDVCLKDREGSRTLRFTCPRERYGRTPTTNAPCSLGSGASGGSAPVLGSAPACSPQHPRGADARRGAAPGVGGPHAAGETSVGMGRGRGPAAAVVVVCRACLGRRSWPVVGGARGPSRWSFVSVVWSSCLPVLGCSPPRPQGRTLGFTCGRKPQRRRSEGWRPSGASHCWTRSGTDTGLQTWPRVLDPPAAVPLDARGTPTAPPHLCQASVAPQPSRAALALLLAWPTHRVASWHAEGCSPGQGAARP